MFKKMMKDAAAKARNVGAELEKASKDPNLRAKVDQIVGDAPLPLSGILRKGERSSHGGQQPSIAPRKHQSDVLPWASVRDEQIEQQILTSLKEAGTFPDLELALCILSSHTWSIEIDANIGAEAMVGRSRWVHVVGKGTDGENIVKRVFVKQDAHQQSTREHIDDPALFAGNPFVIEETHPEYVVVPDEAMSRGIQMKTRRILTPITIHNRMMCTVKVQSLNTKTDDYEEIRIPPRTRKVFNYLEDCDTFNVRDAETSRLIKSFDPKQPGFGFSVLDI